MRILRLTAGVVVAAAIGLFSQSAFSEPSLCPLCDDDFSMCDGNLLQHQFVGYWPYDGHTGYHAGYMCGACSGSHGTCTIGAAEAYEAINLAVKTSKDFEAAIATFAKVASFDRQRNTIVIKACDGDTYAEIHLGSKPQIVG